MPISQTTPGVRELVCISAILISTVALSIDIMLPSLGNIADNYGISGSNKRQWVITSVLAGLSVGQLLLGPAADHIGRRPVIFLGTGLLIGGSVIAVNAETYEWLLAGRMLQGVGAAGPRIAIVALIRDRFEGQEMARIMSIIMGVFIFIPTLAPSFGQLLLLITDWRGLILFVAAFCSLGAVWLYFRQPETLTTPASFEGTILRNNIKHILTSRTPMIYTLCSACCFGAFLGFIISAQQIFQDLYQVGNQFALLFGICSAFVGASTFINARLVKTIMMEKICMIAMLGLVVTGCIFATISFYYRFVPPFYVWMLFSCCSLFLLGITFGNYNAIALRQLGHVAGLASAIYATINTLLSVLLASFIGFSFNMTTLPVTLGYIIFGTFSLLLMRHDHAQRERK